MLPSRGLRPATFLSATSRLSSSTQINGLRKLSTAIPQSSRILSRCRTANANPLLRGDRWRSNAIPAAAISSISSIRFKSTAPTPAPPVEAATSPADAVAPAADAVPSPDALPTLEELTKEISAADIANMPEHIGYLKHIGLDYGWGPTSIVQWLLEHVHMYTGTPWWASIILTTALVRLSTFYFYLGASDSMAKQNALKDILNPLNEKMMASYRAGDTAGAMAARQELIQVRKDAGLGGVMASMKGPLIQGMLGFGAFRLIRGMANIPVPGFLEGGFGWVKDLSVSDPYFILPVTTAMVMHLTGRAGGETGVQNLQPMQKKLLLYGLPALSLFAMSFMPAALQLSFVTGTVLGLVQTSLLRVHSVRNFFRLAPLITTAPIGTATVRSGPKLNMSPVYQAPTAQKILRDLPKGEEVPSSIVGGVKKWFSDSWKEARDKAAAYSGTGAPQKKGGRSADFQRIADEYEKRRQMEMKQEKEWKRQVDKRK